MTAAEVTAVTGLIGAVTGLLWPVIAVVVLYAFRGPAMRALNRVSDDGGTIEVFGVKVNVGKATEEQQRLIEDLQQQVATLRDAARVQGEIGRPAERESGFLDPSTLSGRSRAAPPPPPRESGFLDPSTLSGRPRAAPPPDGPGLVFAEPPSVAPRASSPTAMFGSTVTALPPMVAAGSSSPAPRSRPAAPRVLWVDDHPENNAVLMASLRDRGFVVVEALSTDAALERFVHGTFDAVVSDMGRTAADDGVTLTERIRARDGDVPILIYCSLGAKRVYGPFATRVGASLVTDSPSIVMQHLLELQGGAA